MAIMISIPAGIIANQEATEELSENCDAYISDMEEEISKTLTLVECSLSSGFMQGMRPGFMCMHAPDDTFCPGCGKKL